MGALTLVGAVLSAASAVAASQAEADAADFSAEVSQQQAERERKIAERDAAEHRRHGSRQLATTRARRAGRGVSLEGSPLLVEQAAAGDIELGAREILSDGAETAQALRQRAALQRAQAAAGRAAGYRRAGSTLLTTASRYGSGGITVF
jgi:hypothetical protein